MSNRHEAWNFWKQDDIKRECCVRTPRDLQFACSCTWLHSAHALTHKPNDGIIGTRTVSTAVCELVCACALPDSRHTSGAASGTLMSLFPSSGSMQKCFGVDREATSIPMVTWHLDWQSYLPLHAMHEDGALFLKYGRVCHMMTSMSHKQHFHRQSDDVGDATQHKDDKVRWGQSLECVAGAVPLSFAYLVYSSRSQVSQECFCQKTKNVMNAELNSNQIKLSKYERKAVKISFIYIGINQYIKCI